MRQKVGNGRVPCNERVIEGKVGAVADHRVLPCRGVPADGSRRQRLRQAVSTRTPAGRPCRRPRSAGLPHAETFDVHRPVHGKPRPPRCRELRCFPWHLGSSRRAWPARRRLLAVEQRFDLRFRSREQRRRRAGRSGVASVPGLGDATGQQRSGRDSGAAPAPIARRRERRSGAAELGVVPRSMVTVISSGWTCGMDLRRRARRV